jgi:hypothetical protein
MTRIEKGYYKGEIKGKVFYIIYNDDLEGELLWSIHFEDDDFGETVFAEEDQLWYTKREAMEMANYFVERYSNVR